MKAWGERQSGQIAARTICSSGPWYDIAQGFGTRGIVPKERYLSGDGGISADMPCRPHRGANRICASRPQALRGLSRPAAIADRCRRLSSHS